MEQDTADCLSISAAEHNSSVNNTNHQNTGKNVIANFLALHIPLLSTNYFAQDKFLFKHLALTFLTRESVSIMNYGEILLLHFTKMAGKKQILKWKDV